MSCLVSTGQWIGRLSLHVSDLLVKWWNIRLAFVFSLYVREFFDISVMNPEQRAIYYLVDAVISETLAEWREWSCCCLKNVKLLVALEHREVIL